MGARSYDEGRDAGAFVTQVGESVPGDILVVDDDEDSLRLLTELLSEDGHHVRPADSGELALLSAAAKPPELVLLDIHMPLLSGFEVCQALKAKDATRDVPVVFISSATAVEEHVECFRVGGVAFINKPIVREELLARVRTHVELGRLQRHLEYQVGERTEQLLAAYERLERELADRKQAEGALRESEQRFRNMADTAPVMIWISGRDKGVTFFSRAWLEFRGRTIEELGNGWTEGVHPDDLKHVLRTYQESFDALHKYELDYRLLRQDGEYRWILSTGVPRFMDGVFVGYIGSCIDITDLRRTHEERTTAQKMESLGALAAGIAHDFNNLLGSVLAEADLALSAPHNGWREHVERITSVAVRAAETVSLLMAYAGTRAAPVPGPVDVSEVVEETLRLSAASIAGNAVLNVDLPKSLPPVLSHRPELQRVIMNLVRNAVEALEGREGCIAIATSLVHVAGTDRFPGHIEVIEGDYVRLTVSDTGRGMTEESISRAFEPFYTTKFLGRGLGLAVVHGIVRSEGGIVRISSKIGQGTTFEVLLPCTDSNPMEGRQRHPEVGAASQRISGSKVVLLVEDEYILRMPLTMALQRQGYSVVPAPDGESALQLFAENHIDVVLLDVTLPGMSGFEVRNEMLRMKPDASIILTSARDPGTLSHLGGSSETFLRKPFRVGELVNALNTVLGKPSAGSSTG